MSSTTVPTRYCGQCQARRPVHNFHKRMSSDSEPQQEPDPNLPPQASGNRPEQFFKVCTACREQNKVRQTAARKAKKQKLTEKTWLKCSWNLLCEWIENGYYPLQLSEIDIKHVCFRG